jgi:hypothetical protein
MWKGTAEILKARPAITKTSPRISPTAGVSPAATMAAKISPRAGKLVDPAKP